MSEFVEVRTIILKDFRLIITITEEESFYLSEAAGDQAQQLFFPGYTVSRPNNLYKLMAKTNGSHWITLKWFFYGQNGDFSKEVDIHGSFVIFWK